MPDETLGEFRYPKTKLCQSLAPPLDDPGHQGREQPVPPLYDSGKWPWKNLATAFPHGPHSLLRYELWRSTSTRSP